MRRFWIFVSLLAAAAGGAAGFRALRTAGGQPAEQQGRVVHPEQRELRTSVTSTGPVRMRVGAEVRVGAQVSGMVKKLNVTVGSHVSAGEVIAEIDDRPIQARLADAQAQAELDHASMERARANHERARRLADEGLVPAQQEEDLRLALAEAEARYRKSLRDSDLVKVDLSYTEIRAPISGTVASVSTQEGETVAASFAAPTFVTIIADHALELVAMVDETDVANVRASDPATFTVDAYPSRDFSGVVEKIAPKATIVSGVVNYEVSIEIRKDAGLLKPDMTANISIETARHQALVVPNAAVRREGEEAFVMLAGKNGPERRLVVAGGRENGMVEIKKGLLAGDSVVVPAAEGEGRKPT